MKDSGSAPPPAVAVVGGTGALGSGLALRLAVAGIPVRLGSRKAETAAQAVTKLRDRLPDGAASVDGFINSEAVEGCEIVFLTVPFRAQVENITNLKDALRPGQILVDATAPLASAIGGKATRTLGVWQGSAGQQAADLVADGVAVVSALQTISAVPFGDLDQRLDEDVLICADDKAAKATVARAIESIEGLRAVDCGRLEMAHVAEQITALLIGVNIRYKTHAGIHFTGLPAREW